MSAGKLPTKVAGIYVEVGGVYYDEEVNELQLLVFGSEISLDAMKAVADHFNEQLARDESVATPDGPKKLRNLPLDDKLKQLAWAVGDKSSHKLFVRPRTPAIREGFARLYG